MSIIEKNVLIAEFLKLPRRVLGPIVNYDVSELEIVGDGLEPVNLCEPEEMLFHQSWDWLMYAIEKCRESQIFGSQRLITNIDNRLLKLDILGVYANVVEFIEFYNSNKYPINE